MAMASAVGKSGGAVLRAGVDLGSSRNNRSAVVTDLTPRCLITRYEACGGAVASRRAGLAGLCGSAIDGEGEFGEGGREPMLWVLLRAEFVVATSEVLDEGVASADHGSSAVV